MTTDSASLNTDVFNLTPANQDEWFERKFAAAMTKMNEARTPRLSIMATKGTMDWAYTAFIIGSTAAAMGWKVTIFCTFYGLTLLKKDLDLQITPLGNPAMPMKMPFGPQWFQNIEWNIPNLVVAGVPGFETLATSLMKMTLQNKHVATVAELRDACVEEGVDLIACQMTVDLFGWDKADFIPGVTEWAGAATYLAGAQGADVTLFM
jgi:peroxiredoxin family protein